MQERIDEVLEFWFGPDPNRPIPEALRQRWFRRSDAFDAEIRRRFGADATLAARGELDDWAGAARGRLALVIVLDQFSRNLHRGEPEAFACDERAERLVLEGLERGDDGALSPFARPFFYMPLMHAENLELQERGVTLFEALGREHPESQGSSFADYARKHRDVIARFGRFPHRNRVLGRSSTQEEIAFLEQPGSSFG